MSVTTKEVAYIADLARLTFSGEECEKLAGELNKILDYMEELEQVDTSEVEPLEYVIEMQYEFRKDNSRQTITHKEALKNAPDADGDYFRVPRVIE